MRRFGTVLAAAAVLAALARAHGGDERAAAPPAAAAPKPDTPSQAVGKALAAFAANDGDALRALAERHDPDPWIVADELCARGEFDAADAFAGAAPRPDVERLPGHVAAQRASPTDPAVRRATIAARAALGAKDFAAALAAADGAAPAARGFAAARCHLLRGISLRALRRHEESVAAFRRAAAEAEAVGWLAAVAGAFHDGGVTAMAWSDPALGVELWSARLAVEERRGNGPGLAATWANLCNACDALGDYAAARAHGERAVQRFEEMGDRPGLAGALNNLGTVMRALGQNAKARELHEHALAVREALGDRAGAARALHQLGQDHEMLGDYATAREHIERSLAIREGGGDTESAAKSLNSLARVLLSLGEPARARECSERSLRIRQDAGDRRGVAVALATLGRILAAQGQHEEAMGHLERSLAMAEATGNRVGEAEALTFLGELLRDRGDLRAARAHQERALRILEALGRNGDAARTLTKLGAVHAASGDYARACECLERAVRAGEELRDRQGTAAALGHLGALCRELGDDQKARRHLERALGIFEELGNPAGTATALVALGSACAGLEDYAAARNCFERALAIAEARRDRAVMAAALTGLGVVCKRLEDFPAARRYYERALSIQSELGDPAGRARALQNLGVVCAVMRDFTTARDCTEQAVALAEEVGDRAGVARRLLNLGVLQLAERDAAGALESARRAVRLAAGVTAGLADEEGARARGRYANGYAVGARAAARLADPGGAAFFLESGRAGALLEGLHGRETLRDAAIPAELGAAESAARASETASAARLQAAVRGGDLTAIAACREDLDRARTRVAEAIERIQREAKAGAAVVCPEADTLAAIQGRLRGTETLLVYGLFDEEPLALVVTAKDARLVALPKTTDVEAACASLAADRRDADPSATIATLTKLVIEPLALDAKTTRVLVSPDGALSYVPFALLLPDREVCYVPSGTTYGLLLEDAAKRGEGVLALGDPDYGVKTAPMAQAVAMRGGVDLVRLPATGEEAKAVGTVTLLGRDATEAGLRDALAKKPRWRAVHLACHGLVDPERPMFSSLALTPSGEDDGFLTALEVFRMKCPADLVVLSACETGKGKVYRAEGIVGLTRAFMFAGAPRVLVSLWKVDDEATRALMTKFYELWNPKDGKGVAAATALRQAQEFVRSQEKWKHPRFWAAWVLWGLG